MGELLLNGFSIQEAITILLKIQAITKIHLQNAQRLLQEGHPFYDVLQQMGFSSEKLVQVELAEMHGNLIETLKGIAEQFRLVEEFRKELKKMISYPCLLLFFYWEYLLLYGKWFCHNSLLRIWSQLLIGG
nr:type II secretion system F family protein [Enterococcus durans]